MTPLLLPIAGGLAILLLLGLLLHLRRKAREVEPDAGLDDAEFEDDRAFVAGFDDDTDIVPMLSYDDQPAWDEPIHEATDEADEALDETDESDESDDRVHTPEPLPDAESVRVRYLRAQVRTLQEALEQQDVPGTPAGGSAEATFRRQVDAALRGLGERTREDESPERTLARVVAAIDRLDAPDEVSRPVLPTVKFDLSGAQMSLAGRQYLATPAALMHAPAPVADAVPDPAQARGPGTVTTPLASALAAGVDSDHGGQPPAGRYSDLDPFAQDEQVLPPPPEPDVVRPVPPPASHRDERHRRFGRRRGA